MASSNSSSSNTTTTEDNRIIAEDEAIAINSRGDVQVHMVPDEAFDLASDALFTVENSTRQVVDAFGDALESTQAAARSESADLADKIIKIGIPALAVAYLAGRIFKNG